MDPIRSGTTTERIVRTGILTVVLLTYALWCFWDGYHAWPRKNLEQLVQALTPVPAPENYPEIDPQITGDRVEPLHEQLRTGQLLTEADVQLKLGEPAVREQDKTYYFGSGGMVKVEWRQGRVSKIRWEDKGLKTDGDLLVQKIMGLVIGLLGLAMTAQLIRALMTRAELSDAGLKVNSQGGLRFGGSPLVPFEAMTGLGQQDYKKKGWVEVEYKLSDGTEGSVSLNDYVHKAFPKIVTEICRRRVFDNPVKATDKVESDGKEVAEAAPAVDKDPDDSGQADS
ncbi:MAG: hypothetical protein ACYSUQ_08670 [Planctomycetota bacterium]|jgi:hypothetical protein